MTKKIAYFGIQVLSMVAVFPSSAQSDNGDNSISGSSDGAGPFCMEKLVMVDEVKWENKVRIELK